ncbi:UDP-3-O-(3-hydroxymyristoyl)glucosamine N-acyltransferase [Acidobacteria bacterium AH-259-D05]|nr:UDP-3-O-(3-hydroxymyristoyl)glucosamine N-acyltransferase [Acidobacteria bacterium AH-259-D05]
MVGDSQIEIHGIQPFESAGPGDLTLASEKKYQEHLEQTRASAVVVSPDVASTKKSLLQVQEPKVAFARLLGLFHQKPFAAQGISPLAHVSETSSVSRNVSIYPFVFIGDEVVIQEEVTLYPGVYVGNHCVIGSECVLHPSVTLYDDVSLGSRVILHSGVVIGADGFGYVFDGHRQVKIPQTGRVVIEDDVEIGANSCVDRATFGATVIEQSVKLDNHVHIGHNCRIGENTVIVAQVGISGSVEIGKRCIFAGHSGTVDHVKIGDEVSVMMKTAITKDIPSHSVVSGQPAMEHRQWMKIEALTRQFPEIYREWKKWLKKGEKDNDDDAK